MLDQATGEEPAQHALDDGAERAVLLGEAPRIHPQELLEMLLHEPKERGLPRPPRPIHPRADLHATPTAGHLHLISTDGGRTPGWSVASLAAVGQPPADDAVSRAA